MTASDEPYPSQRADGAPICQGCGVTALPGSAAGVAHDFVCDNADCEAFGERV